MILSNEDVIDIVKTYANQAIPGWIANMRDYNKELAALVNGTEFNTLLYRIEHKEDDKQLQARKRYSHSIRDLFERTLRPLDNVYTATGGSKTYNIDTDKQEKLIKVVSKMRDGKPLEKWLQRNWMPLYHTDPAGVIFYEYTKEKFYPTYKNISSIRCYKSDGQQLEWILFEGKQEEDNKTIKWRVVDDENDYIVIQDNESFTIPADSTFKHPFKKTPGLIISDIIVIGSEERRSPIHAVLELAKESLRDESHKSMFKFLLWDPIFARYAQKCPKCNGVGTAGSGADVCDMCNGSRLYIKKDITDTIILGLPDDKDSPVVLPENIAKFIIPPIEIMGEFNKEIDRLEDRIYTTIWGTINYSKIYQNQRAVDKTATEIVYDTAPQIARLNDYADVAEFVEQYLTDLAANFVYGDVKNTNEDDEAICHILYGRNYIIEPVNVLLERYETSRTNGSNTAILDKELEEWMFAKYKNDTVTLEDELKRVKIEPFIHFTAEQVNTLFSVEEGQKKMLFTEWWKNDADKELDCEELRVEFDKWCDERIVKDEPGQEQPDPILSKYKKIDNGDGTFKYVDAATNEEVTDVQIITTYDAAQKRMDNIQVNDDSGGNNLKFGNH